MTGKKMIFSVLIILAIDEMHLEHVLSRVTSDALVIFTYALT